MIDLTRAKEKLITCGFTCVLRRDNKDFTTTLRGVKPLVAWYESGQNFSGFCAADKVVGKATAFLYVLLGVKAVYAKVMSKAAFQVLQENGIAAEYGELVEHIINRNGDGICPFEAAVLDISSPTDAYKTIRDKMRELNITLD